MARKQRTCMHGLTFKRTAINTYVLSGYSNIELTIQLRDRRWWVHYIQRIEEGKWEAGIYGPYDYWADAVGSIDMEDKDGTEAGKEQVEAQPEASAQEA